MGKIKTGLLIGTALLAGSAIGSGKGLSLLEFGENILTCFVELFNSITGQSVGAEEKGEDIPSTVDETKSDAAKRTQQAADMGAEEAVESTDGKALSADAAEITQAQLCFVNKKSLKSEGKFPSFVLGIPQFRKVA